MDTMILYGRNFSPFTRRVAITLNHLGVAYEQKPLSTLEDIEAIRLLNPLGRVPCLSVAEEVLIDSDAIIDYLLSRDPQHTLLPQALDARQRCMYDNALAKGVMEKCVAYFYETARREPALVSETVAKHYQNQVMQGLEALDSRLLLKASEQQLDLSDISIFVAYQSARSVFKDQLPTFSTLARMSAVYEAWPTFHQSPL